MMFQHAFFVIYVKDFLQPVPAAALSAAATCLVWRAVKRSGISG